MNRMLGTPVVEACRGGPRGGGARLSKAGHGLVANYRAIEQAAQQAALPRLAGLLGRAKGCPPD